MLRRIVTGVALTIVSLFVMGGVASATSAASPSPTLSVTYNVTINNVTLNFLFINSTLIVNGGKVIDLTL